RGAARQPAVGEPEPGRFPGGEAGERSDEVARAQPGPVRAAAVQGVRALVGPVGALGGAGPAAEGVVGLVDGDLGSRLRGGDGGGESGEAAAEDRKSVV